MDRILELQEIDTAVDRLEARRTELEGGAEVKLAREDVRALEDQVAEIKLGLDAIHREQTRLETEVDTLQRKVADEEKRLYDGSVANPKELESIQHEVAGLKQRTSRIEDAILEEMTKREDLESGLPALETKLAEARARLEELGASSEHELEEIVESLGTRRADRERLTPEIDEELLELYEDLRAQKRGIGAALLEDGVCGGCRQKLSALELDRIKRTEGIRRCEYCRRILILA